MKIEKQQQKENKSWMEIDGELTVDIYSTKKELVIQSAVAGVNPEDIDVTAEGDMIIIKGKRSNPSEDKEKNYFFQECYWGKFSRKIISPEEIDSSGMSAVIKSGVLTIRIPLTMKEKKFIQVKKS